MTFLNKTKANVLKNPQADVLFVNEVHDSMTPEQAYREAYKIAHKSSKIDIKTFQERACQDPCYAYWFARDVPGADIKYCQDAACKDPQVACHFAYDVPGANLLYCQRAAYRDLDYVRKFEENIKWRKQLENQNIKNSSKQIVKQDSLSGNLTYKNALTSPQCAYYFAEENQGNPEIDIKKYQEVACKDAFWAYLFARDIPGADIEKCQEAACSESKYAYEFAHVSGANIERCLKACEGTRWAALIVRHVIEPKKEAARKEATRKMVSTALMPIIHPINFSSILFSYIISCICLPYELYMCRSPRTAYSHALHSKNANIKRCQKAACKDPYYAYLFALNIPGADIKKCQEAACKNSQVAHLFSKFIPGADRDKCFEIANQHDPTANLPLPPAPKIHDEKRELDEVLKEKPMNPYSAYIYARDVRGANIEKYQEVACRKPVTAYLFALNIPGADIEKCQRAACQDPMWAYKFALNIPGANIDICQKAADKDHEVAYMFTQNVPGTDIEKHKEAVSDKKEIAKYSLVSSSLLLATVKLPITIAFGLFCCITKSVYFLWKIIHPWLCSPYKAFNIARDNEKNNIEYNVKAYQRIACKDPYYAQLFALHIPEADIEKCQEAACRSPKEAFFFARDIAGADIEKCQEAACKDPWSACKFAHKIKGADIKKCQEVACLYPKYAYEFAKIPGADFEICQAAACRDPKWADYFAHNIPGADLEVCWRGGAEIDNLRALAKTNKTKPNTQQSTPINALTRKLENFPHLDLLTKVNNKISLLKNKKIQDDLRKLVDTYNAVPVEMLSDQLHEEMLQSLKIIDEKLDTEIQQKKNEYARDISVQKEYLSAKYISFKL